MDPREQAYDDQLRAATREQLRMIEARVRAHPEGSAHGDGHPHPWVEALGDWWEAELRAGRVRTCRHLHPSTPQPMHGCAWMPGLLACSMCVALGAFNVTGPADRICDRCSLDTLEVGIYNGAAMLGPVSIEYGVCPDCYREIKGSIEAQQGGRQ